MGTRGVFGYRVGGEDRLVCAATDAYPSVLGVALLGQLKTHLPHGRLAGLEKFAKANPINPEAAKLLADSLLCEWAYIVNLDDRVFEVYRGFHRKPHGQGRYAKLSPQTPDYFPVALVESLPFDEVENIEPGEWASKLELTYSDDDKDR